MLWIVVLEKALESPWDSKVIKQVNSIGNQSWIFIGRTDAEVEPPTLWPPDEKIWFTGKYLMQGKTEGKKRSGWQRIRQIASPTQWTWVWVNSRCWWWTGRPGVLQSMGLQSRTRPSDWTELIFTYDIIHSFSIASILIYPGTNCSCYLLTYWQQVKLEQSIYLML